MNAPSSPTPVPSATGRVAELYLLLFPLGHLVFLPVGGAVATLADLVLVTLLAAWGVDLLVRSGAAWALVGALGGGDEPGLPGRRYLLGVGVLVLFAALVMASGSWGFHPRYAVAKGIGMGAMAAGAAAIACSGLGRRRATLAWLGGTGAALALTLLLGALGSPSLQERLFYGGSGVGGLPFARVSGPFLHPNMLGDYLVVSALLAWGIRPELTPWGRKAVGVLLGVVAVVLAATLATAWVGAGVAALLVGRQVAREGRHGLALALRAGGTVAAGVTFTFLVLPLEVRLAGLEIVTAAIRPAIWQGSLRAFVDSPLLGVGAAPYLAEAADPLLGGAPGLWDAHNAYLSVLGQFGLVGFALATAGIWAVVTGGAGAPAPASRWHTAVRVALLAVAANALFMASEDLRHLWALLGLCGLQPSRPPEG